MMDFGLLIIRLIIGITFMGHGAQKLFGWFGGYGLKEQVAGWNQSVYALVYLWHLWLAQLNY